MQEQWYLYCKKADFRALSEKFGISPILARILVNRDIRTDEEIDRFLNGSAEDLYDPFLLKGMKEAVSFIYDALKCKQKIRIIGDYDADGVCSAYILYSFFEYAAADVSVRLPDRVKDGYGMSMEMAREAFNDGVGLIITCDNGISANEAVSEAKRLGIRTIITDHHTPPKILPDADVIIDPKQKGCLYPYKEICGAVVAYKLICALSETLYKNEGLDASPLTERLFQYAGIATITDIVPLKDENRIFAKEGLKRLSETKEPGLLALMDIRSVDKRAVSAYHVGFVIGPAINSAGRLKKAELAFELFKEKDTDRARERAKMLSDLNDERKRLTAEQAELAFKIAQEKIKDKRVLVVFLPDAHESVAGIIAGRIKDAFYAPAIVVTKSEDELKGSGRSIPAYNIIEEISKFPELFSKFGGHALACGFTLKASVDELEETLNCACRLTEKDMVKKVWADMQLPFEYATRELAEELSLLEPFGQENERPIFAEKDITVVSCYVAGKNLNALKLSLENKNGSVMDAVMFSDSQRLIKINEDLKAGQAVSILYYPEINEFRKKISVQLRVKDIRY